MIYTFETRLKLDQSQEELLDSSCDYFSKCTRIVWSMKNRQQLSELDIYNKLTKEFNLTAAQTGSIISYVDSLYKRIKELKKVEFNQANFSIKQYHKFIKDKEKSISTKDKLLIKVKKSNLAYKNRLRDNNYYLNLSKIDNCHKKINKYKSQIAQKKKSLIKKESKLNKINKQINSGIYSICFGSKKLLSQRLVDINNEKHNQNPYKDNLSLWQDDWLIARDNFIYSVGKAGTKYCNPEFHYDINNKSIAIKLNDNLANDRMLELEKELNIKFSDLKDNTHKSSSLRMQCKYLTIDNVEFNYNKDLANQYLKVILNPKDKTSKIPLTYKIIKRKIKQDIDSKLKDKNIAYYLQVSFDTQELNVKNNLSNNHELYYLDKTKGILGVDFNEKGVAWTIVKSDGNRMVDKNSENTTEELNINKENNKLIKSGFIKWRLKGKSTNQAKWIIEDTVHKLVKIASTHEVGIAIENLDFSKQKLTIAKGKKNRTYNHMLSFMATAKFKEAIIRISNTNFIKLYLANPTFSSIGGFTKYGLINHVPVDIAASHWLARQALYGIIYKEEDNQIYVKYNKESISLPYLSSTAKQSKNSTDGLTKWSEVGSALGTDRRLWSKNLHLLIDFIVGNNPLSTHLTNEKDNLKEIINPFEDRLIFQV